jgi:hypothetical protein
VRKPHRITEASMVTAHSLAEPSRVALSVTAVVFRHGGPPQASEAMIGPTLRSLFDIDELAPGVCFVVCPASICRCN